jgi:hypothetical protein
VPLAPRLGGVGGAIASSKYHHRPTAAEASGYIGVGDLRAVYQHLTEGRSSSTTQATFVTHRASSCQRVPGTRSKSVCFGSSSTASGTASSPQHLGL